MNRKDIFGLAVWLSGLVFFYRGVVMLTVAFVTGWTFPHAASSSPPAGGWLAGRNSC